MNTDTVVPRLLKACEAAGSTPEEVAMLAGVSTYSILHADLTLDEVDHICQVLGIDYLDVVVR